MYKFNLYYRRHLRFDDIGIDFIYFTMASRRDIKIILLRARYANMPHGGEL